MKQVDFGSLAGTVVAAIVACVAMYLVSKNGLPISAALAIVSATHAGVGAMRSFIVASVPAAAAAATSAPATAASEAPALQDALKSEIAAVTAAPSAGEDPNHEDVTVEEIPASSVPTSENPSSRKIS